MHSWMEGRQPWHPHPCTEVPLMRIGWGELRVPVPVHTLLVGEHWAASPFKISYNRNLSVNILFCFLTLTDDLRYRMDLALLTFSVTSLAI